MAQDKKTYKTKCRQITVRFNIIKSFLTFPFFYFSMFPVRVVTQRLSVWTIKLAYWTKETRRYDMLVFHMHPNICCELGTVSTFSTTP